MSSFVRNMLKEQAAKEKPAPSKSDSYQSRPFAQSKSYCDARDIVGAAIVRKIRNEIGYDEARAIIYQKYRAARGEVYRSIATDEAFQEFGYGLICKFAETLGIDPNVAIAEFVLSKRPEIVEVLR